MQINAITVCVDYSDLLERSIDLWKPGCDKLTVVTAPADYQTIDLCHAKGVDCLLTDFFYCNGAIFNKASALAWAYEFTEPTDWQLFFDADVIPPADWRKQVDVLHPILGNLYGCRRELEDGKSFPDRELAGFFHLFHVSDPAASRRPLFPAWKTAAAYDSEFQSRWPHDRRMWIEMTLKHLGQPGQNWCGRGNTEAMAALFKDRREKRGHRHEQMPE